MFEIDGSFDEALENRMGAAWIKSEWIKDLYLIRIVSFCRLQLVPARASRMLIRDEARVMIESMWEEKMIWVSKITPISVP